MTGGSGAHIYIKPQRAAQILSEGEIDTEINRGIAVEGHKLLGDRAERVVHA